MVSGGRVGECAGFAPDGAGSLSWLGGGKQLFMVVGVGEGKMITSYCGI